MSLLVCPYCRGTKFNRHDKPEEISNEFWDHVSGPLNLCLLCKGHGKIGQDAFNRAGETGLVFLSTKTEPRKVLVSCPSNGCRKWADVTAIFDRRGSPVEVVAHCPAGHDMTIELE